MSLFKSSKPQTKPTGYDLNHNITTFDLKQKDLEIRQKGKGTRLCA